MAEEGFGYNDMADVNAQNTMRVLEQVDRPLIKSKKFVFAMCAQLTWKALIGYGIVMAVSDTVLLAMIAAAGSVETAGMAVQAWHDRYIKSETLKALNGSVKNVDPAV